MTTASLPRRSARLLHQSPFRLFAAVGLFGSLVIGGAVVVASQRAGEAEAVNDVEERTQTVAVAVVEPNLTVPLLAGSPDAIARLDEIVDDRVLGGSTVRVKLWDATGRIVYSDEARLIGERYELDDDKEAALWSGSVSAEISSLSGPENRFEADQGDLLEVYLPITGPDGRPLLYESYFAMSEVSDSAARIRATFLPIAIGAVLILEGLHLGLAWGLQRRLRRGQREREHLLGRALDASDRERRRIAADLHDGVVQDLVGASFAVTAAADQAGRHAPEVADDLRSAAVSTRRSLQSLRSLLVDIYPPSLQEQGLEAALVDLLAPAASMGIETELRLSGDVDADPEVAALVYRVVQEAVRNVFRHAEATTIEVRVEAGTEGVTAAVSDDGRGFASGADRGDGTRLGLRLLGDLTADAGASFHVDSVPGRGTEVHLEVPV